MRWQIALMRIFFNILRHETNRPYELWYAKSIEDWKATAMDKESLEEIESALQEINTLKRVEVWRWVAKDLPGQQQSKEYVDTALKGINQFLVDAEDYIAQERAIAPTSPSPDSDPSSTQRT